MHVLPVLVQLLPGGLHLGHWPGPNWCLALCQLPQTPTSRHPCPLPWRRFFECGCSCKYFWLYWKCDLHFDPPKSTLPETNHFAPGKKKPRPQKGKQSSSNHPSSGAFWLISFREKTNSLPLQSFRVWEGHCWKLGIRFTLCGHQSQGLGSVSEGIKCTLHEGTTDTVHGGVNHSHGLGHHLLRGLCQKFTKVQLDDGSCSSLVVNSMIQLVVLTRSCHRQNGQGQKLQFGTTLEKLLAAPQSLKALEVRIQHSIFLQDFPNRRLVLTYSVIVITTFSGTLWHWKILKPVPVLGIILALSFCGSEWCIYHVRATRQLCAFPPFHVVPSATKSITPNVPQKTRCPWDLCTRDCWSLLLPNHRAGKPKAPNSPRSTVPLWHHVVGWFERHCSSRVYILRFQGYSK